MRGVTHFQGSAAGLRGRHGRPGSHQYAECESASTQQLHFGVVFLSFCPPRNDLICT